MDMVRLRKLGLLLMVLAITAGACENIFRKDQSFTIKEYESKGMPDIREVWGEKELIKAHVTLGNVRTANFFTLPVKRSSKSGDVFRKIVSHDNLSFLDDPSKALHDKAFEIQTIANFENEISRMYSDNLRTEQYYSTELIDIYIFELYIRGRMLDLAEKIMNSRDPEDRAMSSGRQAIVGSYVNLTTKLLREQKRTEAFNARDLKKLSLLTTNSLHENVKYLDAESKQKLSAEIRDLNEKVKSRSLGKNLAEMLKFLSE